MIYVHLQPIAHYLYGHSSTMTHVAHTHLTDDVCTPTSPMTQIAHMHIARNLCTPTSPMTQIVYLHNLCLPTSRMINVYTKQHIARNLFGCTHIAHDLYLHMATCCT